jgi:hypothetical protein
MLLDGFNISGLLLLLFIFVRVNLISAVDISCLRAKLWLYQQGLKHAQTAKCEVHSSRDQH